jgi:phage minor structural protein
MTVTCLLNLEDLQGNPFLTFSVVDKTLLEAAEIALQGTGWTVGECDVDKIRSAGMVNCNSLETIDNLSTAWMCDHSYDTIHKKVNFYQKMGEKRGAYFLEGLNLKQITKDVDSYDYYTRIVPIGANDITIESVNDGKNYLENYQYSSKILTYIWKDDTYTDPQTLMEDAEEKLKEMSKPAETYSCDVVCLAKQRKDYNVLDYSLGDEIRLISRQTRTMTEQRITKIVEYPEDPMKNTCEFSNTENTFTEMQEKLKKATDIINYVMSSTGQISVSDILNLENGISGSSTVRAFNDDITELKKTVQSLADNNDRITDLEEQMQRVIEALAVTFSTE